MVTITRSYLLELIHKHLKKSVDGKTIEAVLNAIELAGFKFIPLANTEPARELLARLQRDVEETEEAIALLKQSWNDKQN